MNEFPADDKVTDWTAEAMRLIDLLITAQVDALCEEAESDRHLEALLARVPAAREALRAHLAAHPAVAGYEVIGWQWRWVFPAHAGTWSGVNAHPCRIVNGEQMRGHPDTRWEVRDVYAAMAKEQK